MCTKGKQYYIYVLFVALIFVNQAELHSLNFQDEESELYEDEFYDLENNKTISHRVFLYNLFARNIIWKDGKIDLGHLHEDNQGILVRKKREDIKNSWAECLFSPETCTDNTMESDSWYCNEPPCAYWTDWIGGEDLCSASCGGGRRVLVRHCMHGEEGKDCIGKNAISESCNEHPCPEWTKWQTTGNCSTSCGKGYSLSKRECKLGNESADGCYGPSVGFHECERYDCGPRWSKWSSFGDCLAQPGKFGNKTRHRNCLLRGAIIDSENCPGSSWNSKPCTGTFTNGEQTFSNWSSCSSVTCDKLGSQVRQIFDHTGDSKVESRECISVSCESLREDVNTDHASWTEWKGWSECNASCDAQGMKFSQRYCAQKRGDLIVANESCEGISIKWERCSLDECGYWGEWSKWTNCNCSTNYRKSRTRACLMRSQTENTTDFEEVANALCPGGQAASKDSLNCSLTDCPSSWNSWSGWTKCSISCGRGMQERTRECNAFDGSQDCFGEHKEVRYCFNPPCWTEWRNLTECTQSCGGGYYIRVRRCKGRTRAVKDYQSCVGSHRDFVTCNTQVCPTWGSWSEYTPCSVSCGTGYQIRSRACLQGNCEGDSQVNITCHYKSCPSWGDWTPYSCCSKSCGPGIKIRKRECIHGNVGDPGCTGENRIVTPCLISDMKSCKNKKQSYNTKCGIVTRPKTTSNSISILKILGGRKAADHEWPWQGSWQYNYCVPSSDKCKWDHLCGATLIHPLWVVTAAHCILETKYQKIILENPGDLWSVVIGMRTLGQDGDRYFLRQIFPHEKYSYRTVPKNDIALLKLNKSVSITDYVMPACLPNGDSPRHKQDCFVSGWGDTSLDSDLSPVLNGAPVKFMKFGRCQAAGYLYNRYLNEKTHMCAGGDGTDTCPGDSGGPLVCVNKSGNWYISGVTSFGFYECGTDGNIGIYSNVLLYERWIKNTIELYSHEKC